MATEAQLLQFQPWDRATITPATGYIQLNSRRFTNATQSPFYLDGLRFMTTHPMDVFSILNVQVRRGAFTPLTRDFMPMWLLGQEFNRQITPNPLKAIDSETPVYTFQRNWMFPQPLLMSPDDDLIVEIQLEGSAPGQHGSFLNNLPAGGRSIDLYAMMLTRSLPSDFEIPNTICVPWASWYRTPDFSFGVLNEGDRFVSNQGQLINPHDEPVKVEKMTGRLFVGGFDVFDIGDAYQDVLIPPQIDAAYNLVSLRLNRADAKSLIRNYTPFGSVFHIADNAWLSKTIMAPRSYYIARARADLRPYSTEWPGTPYDGSVSWMDISLQGYREVRIK